MYAARDRKQEGPGFSRAFLFMDRRTQRPSSGTASSRWSPASPEAAFRCCRGEPHTFSPSAHRDGRQNSAAQRARTRRSANGQGTANPPEGERGNHAQRRHARVASAAREAFGKEKGGSIVSVSRRIGPATGAGDTLCRVRDVRDRGGAASWKREGMGTVNRKAERPER